MEKMTLLLLLLLFAVGCFAIGVIAGAYAKKSIPIVQEKEYEWKYIGGDLESMILSVDGTIILKSNKITVINRSLTDEEMKAITK